MSWHCKDCQLNWPFNSSFLTCPGCGEKTKKREELGMPYPEATALMSRFRSDRAALRAAAKTRQQFEDHYAERAVAELRAGLDQWAAQL